tara:strand:- start:52 stop:294 length:243 start_codon:yes stop_codon:yes gene_type:complete
MRTIIFHIDERGNAYGGGGYGSGTRHRYRQVGGKEHPREGSMLSTTPAQHMINIDWKGEILVQSIRYCLSMTSCTEKFDQ